MLSFWLNHSAPKSRDDDKSNTLVIRVMNLRLVSVKFDSVTFKIHQSAGSQPSCTDRCIRPCMCLLRRQAVDGHSACRNESRWRTGAPQEAHIYTHRLQEGSENAAPKSLSHAHAQSLCCTWSNTNPLKYAVIQVLMLRKGGVARYAALF